MLAQIKASLLILQTPIVKASIPENKKETTKYVYKLVDTKTLKFNISEVIKLAWKWHRAGKKWSNAMKQAYSDARHERFTLTFRPAENPCAGMENMDREAARYYTKGT